MELTNNLTGSKFQSVVIELASWLGITPGWILDKGIDLALTIASVVIGFYLGVAHHKEAGLLKERQSRLELLRALLGSLDQNLNYLIQMTDTHMKKGEFPTFYLDTAWLHYFATASSTLIPESSGYRERYNKLRFELDHINNKLLIEVIRVSSGRPSIREETILPHIEEAKGWITQEQDVLRPLTA